MPKVRLEPVAFDVDAFDLYSSRALNTQIHSPVNGP